MMEQTPCPYRISDDAGSAFLMGSFGGGVYHFIRGARNSPRGWSSRTSGGYEQILMRAPTLGGNFAVWGGLFSMYDCLLAKARKKEDPWNAIMSGALTGGTLSFRAGRKVLLTNMVIGGGLLAVIEGLSFGINRMMSTKREPMPMPPAEGRVGGGSGGSSSGAIGLSSDSDSGFGLSGPEPLSVDDYSFNGEKDFEDDSF